MTSHFAARFHALHSGADGMLLLANAWDAGSARLAQATGASAVATSSAAVAWSHGWPDGDALPIDLLLRTVRAVVDAAGVPVTVDIEAGYSDDPAQVGHLVARVIAAGAVGINLEDGNGAPALLCAKIAAARAAADRADVDLYINARTDVWLRALVAPAVRAAEAVRRAALYRSAGASGLFPAGILEAGDIAAVVQGARMPVNVLARPGMIDIAALQALGVRRCSAGSAISEAAYGLVAAMMREFQSTGRLDAAGVMSKTWSELNGVMTRA